MEIHPVSKIERCHIPDGAEVSLNGAHPVTKIERCPVDVNAPTSAGKASLARMEVSNG
jgi:hypothetical protein